MMIRGVKLFMAGILLNIGLNAHLIYKVLNDAWQINIWHYIFGVDIFHLAGLSLIVIASLIFLFKRNFIPYLIIAIVVVLISSFIPVYSTESNIATYLMAFIHGNSEWSYFPLIPWLAYPLTGFAFQLFEEKYLTGKIALKIKIGSLIVLGIFLILTYQYAAVISHNLQIYYHHGAIFFLWSIMFVILWSLLLSVSNTIAGRTMVFQYVKWLGINVTTVYIFQWLIIGNIATAIFKTQGLTEAIFWFIGITIITSLLTLSWNKFKSVKYLNLIKL